MKFSLRGAMKSNPGLTISNHLDQCAISCNAKASASAQIGELNVTVSEIPVHVRIPFLKRTHRALLIGSVGGAKLSVDPFSISLKEVSFNATGVVGDKDGIALNSDVQVNCRTAMSADGEVAGKVGIGSIDLGDFDCRNDNDHNQDQNAYDSHHEHEQHGRGPLSHREKEGSERDKSESKKGRTRS